MGWNKELEYQVLRNGSGVGSRNGKEWIGGGVYGVDQGTWIPGDTGGVIRNFIVTAMGKGLGGGTTGISLSRIVDGITAMGNSATGSLGRGSAT